jgi:hypothetical protein
VDGGDVARAVGLIEYMEAAEVGSAVVALVVIGTAVGVRNSNIESASAAGILEVIQSLRMPRSTVSGLNGLRRSVVIAIVQSHLRSAISDISVLSYSKQSTALGDYSPDVIVDAEI